MINHKIKGRINI